MMRAAPVLGRTLRFLRALKRNNRREWFHERRADTTRTSTRRWWRSSSGWPRISPRVAPEFVADAEDLDVPAVARHPLQRRQVAAQDPRRRASSRTVRSGGCAAPASTSRSAPGYVWIGGGLYAPDTAALHAVRTPHRRATTARLTRLLAAPAFTERLGAMHGEQAARMPRGFDPAHPAAELLRHKQFLASREEPAEFATRPGFYRNCWPPSWRWRPWSGS